MTPSPLEYKALHGLQHAHELGFSIARALTKAWVKYLFQVALLGGGAVFYWWAGWPLAGALFLGILIGSLLRDLAWLRLYKKLWPLSEQITDWEAVRSLLATRQRP